MKYVILTLLAGFIATGVSLKPNRLKVMLIPPFGISCIAGSNIIVDRVNARADILPDYDLEIVTTPESSATMNYAAKTVVNLLDSNSNPFFDTVKNQTAFMAPIIVGPQTSASCKAIGRVLDKVNAVAVSPICAAPALADRRLSPNLYLTVATGQITAIAELKFIREVGKWNRFAILSFAGNVNDYGTALFMHKTAIQQGFSVSWLDIMVDVDDSSFDMVKKLDIRVVVFFYSGEATFLSKFLCLAYKNGLVGPKYVFMMNYVTYNPPQSTPLSPVCSGNRTILFEQYRRIVWTGPILGLDNVNFGSEFNQSALEFSEQVDQKVNHSGSDFQLRLVCHDALTRAIFALDRADRILKLKNSTLIKAATTRPRELMLLLNETTFNVEFQSIRLGTTSSYNKKSGLVQGDYQLIGQWSPTGRFRYVAFAKQIRDSVEFAFDSYYLERKDSVDWATQNGKPPRDQAKNITVIRKVPRTALIGVASGAGFLIVFEISALILLLVRKPIFFKIKLAGLVGCLTLDAAAVLFVMDGGDYSNSEPMWHARLITLIAGCSLVSGLSSFRGIFSNLNIVHATPASIRSSKSAVKSGRRPKSVIFGKKPTFKSNVELSILVGTLIFLAINLAISAIWLGGVDKLGCSMAFYAPLSGYDPNTDTITETLVVNCKSEKGLAWMLALVFLSLFCLLVGLFYTQRLSQIKKMTKPTEFGPTRTSVLNAMTMLLGCLLVVVVLGGDLIAQQIAIAAVCLLLSFVTSSLYVYPSIREYLLTSNRRAPSVVNLHHLTFQPTS